MTETCERQAYNPRLERWMSEFVEIMCIGNCPSRLENQAEQSKLVKINIISSE